MKVGPVGKIILAPIYGGAFVLFLPFVGFYICFQYLGIKAWYGIKKLIGNG
jgi:hypothetical protein